MTTRRARDIPFHSSASITEPLRAPTATLTDRSSISKLARVVDGFTSPQVQERLIRSRFVDRKTARGVAVVIEATHTCMTCRGVK
jgi:hypothetical protein